jgi:peptidoglycan/LPS O-acetylase OafA/YrhL
MRIFLYSLDLDREPWTNRFFPTELFFFILGIISFRFKVKLMVKKVNFLPNFIFIGIIFMVLFYSKISIISSEQFDYNQLIYFIVLFISIPFVFYITETNKIDRLLGNLSYPAYISHLFIINVLGILGHSKSEMYEAEILIITFLTSLILVICIEMPIDKFRQNRLKINNSQKKFLK